MGKTKNIKKEFRLLTWAAFFIFALASQSLAIEFSMPIDCDYGNNCFIQNYPDESTGPEYRDYKCSYLSYDKHKGTDFRLLNLKQMEEGVNVIAAADGTIRGIRDGMDDVSIKDGGTEKIKGKECGNGVVIRHSSNIESQYCHMNKGSIRVKAGDVVKAGDILGKVGLSGQTEFPHVHFEVRIDGKPKDPFTGNAIEEGCNKLSRSLWDEATAKKLAYIPTGILNSGFTDVELKKEDVEKGATSPAFISKDSTALIFWVQFFGVKPSYEVNIKILSESAEEVAKHHQVFDRSKAVYYQFIGKKYPGGIPPGKYQAIVTITDNNKTILDKKYQVEVR